MNIHKVIFAGLMASVSLAHANPVLKNAEPNAIESVAKIVNPIGTQLTGMTSLPAKPVALAAASDVAAVANSLARAPAATGAGMVRNVNIEVDAPAPAAAVANAPVPMKENDINMFLLLALLVGAILLRRRAE